MTADHHVEAIYDSEEYRLQQLHPTLGVGFPPEIWSPDEFHLERAESAPDIIVPPGIWPRDDVIKHLDFIKSAYRGVPGLQFEPTYPFVASILWYEGLSLKCGGDPEWIDSTRAVINRLRHYRKITAIHLFV